MSSKATVLSTDSQPQCACFNDCGDDPALRKGKVLGCQRFIAERARQAELAALKVDAERYRRLRDEVLTNRADTVALWESSTGAELDAAIDAAIAQAEMLEIGRRVMTEHRDVLVALGKR